MQTGGCTVKDAFKEPKLIELVSCLDIAHVDLCDCHVAVYIDIRHMTTKLVALVFY